jgi:hypothetical protein
VSLVNGLGNVLLAKALDKIVNPIDYHVAPLLLLFLGWVSSIEPGRKNPLRLRPCHRQRDIPVGTDVRFAQPGARPGKAIHHHRLIAAE